MVLFSFGCKKINFDDSVSQLRYDILRGENDNYIVTCYLELRESPYILDGEISPIQNIVVLKLQPKKEVYGKFIAKFSADKDYSKEFSFDAGFNNYVATFQVNTLPEKTLNINVACESGNENITLNSIKQPNIISHEKAIMTVYDKHPEKFTKENDIANYEINARLMLDGGCFWFVSVTNKDQSFCYLVDATNSKIIAEKQLSNA